MNRSLLAATAVTAVGLLLAGGGLAHATDDTPAPGPASSSPTTPTPDRTTSTPTDPALARYYTQRLDWTPCNGAQCAQLAVPVDYAHPDGASTHLAVLRVSSGKATRGALVVNPGGPGISGTHFARSGARRFGPAIAQAYDIVGFDPRGVGGSTPVQCLDGPGMDDLLGADPTPDTPQQVAAARDRWTAFGTACQEKVGPLLQHLSTQDAARDMDVLRAALGQERLDYFGASYGTYLGATYADLFPGRVGHMVLDGAMDPALTSEERARSLATGVERALTAFATDCAHRSCSLGSTPEAVLTTVRDLLARVATSPLPDQLGGPAGGLTQGWAFQAILSALYDAASWPSLESALGYARQGDGSLLLKIATESVGRSDDGTYSTNLYQALPAVNCLDHPASRTIDDYAARAKDFAARWPVLGARIAWDDAVCAAWPAAPVGTPHAVRATGAAPIVVIGTTRDPATPYEQAASLAGQLANGRLLTYDGDGHTAFHRGSTCIDSAVSAYLTQDVVPQEGLRCTPDAAPKG